MNWGEHFDARIARISSFEPAYAVTVNRPDGDTRDFAQAEAILTDFSADKDHVDQITDALPFLCKGTEEFTARLIKSDELPEIMAQARKAYVQGREFRPHEVTGGLTMISYKVKK